MLSADRWICDSSSCSGMQHPRQTSNLKRPQTTTYNPTFLLLKAPVATGMIQSLQHVLLPEIVRIDPWRHTKGLVFQAAKHPRGKAECQAPYRRLAVHRMRSRPPRRRSLPTQLSHASAASAVQTSVQPHWLPWQTVVNPPLYAAASKSSYYWTPRTKKIKFVLPPVQCLHIHSEMLLPLRHVSMATNRTN